MADRDAFLNAIRERPTDPTLRGAYADWLEDHDEPEKASRQRNFLPSYHWLKEFVLRINYGDYDDDLNDIPESKTEGNPHTFEDVIEAGHKAVSGEGYCFGSDDGADFFRDSQHNREEFFRHWSIVTGVRVPQDTIDNPPFWCAC